MVHDEITEPDSGAVTIDEFSTRLSDLRRDAGAPSFAEIAARIARRRQSEGVAPERARIARSTVYDVFRPGRKRLDVELIREILVALGLEGAEVEVWVERARRALPAAAPAPAPEASAALTPELPAAPLPPAAPPRSARRTGALLLACLVLNLLGRELVGLLDLPLHLDMTGTAVAAVVAGPWWGVLVAVATNLSGVTISGVASIPFVLVNVAGALVWGYGVHRWGMGRTIPRFFTLTLLVALVCSLVATPILVLYQGVIIHGSDTITQNVIALAHVVVIGIFLSNLLISVIDKTISGVIALIVLETRSPSLISSSSLRVAPDGAEFRPDAPRPG